MNAQRLNNIMANAAQLFKGSLHKKTITIGESSFEVLQENGFFIINKNKTKIKDQIEEGQLANTLFEVLKAAEAPEQTETPETPADTPADVPTEQTETPAEQPETPADTTANEQPEQTEAPATEQPEQTETPAEQPEILAAATTDANTDILKQILEVTKAQAAKLEALENSVSKIRSKSFDANFAELAAKNEQIKSLKLEITGLKNNLSVISETLASVEKLKANSKASILICENGSDDDANEFIEIANTNIVKNALIASCELLKTQIADRENQILELSKII